MNSSVGETSYVLYNVDVVLLVCTSIQCSTIARFLATQSGICTIIDYFFVCVGAVFVALRSEEPDLIS